MESDIPEVRYARSGDVHIAYQAWGDGPLTFVGIPPVISAVELSWDEPHYERFNRRLANGSTTAISRRTGCAGSPSR